MHTTQPGTLDRAQRDFHLREGDVIFSRIPNPLYHHVAAATGSTTSHVGILFRNPGGEWIVAESGVPLVRYVSLDNFIARSEDGWHVVRRLRLPPEPHQVHVLRAECDRHMGTLYHTGFRYESRRMFCSKFVHTVFRNALGVDIGELQTFAQLLDQRPKTALTFWRFWFFGRIPWSRLTVTPASQFESPQLETVWVPHSPAGQAAPTRYRTQRIPPGFFRQTASA